MNYTEYVCEIHPFVRDQICYARCANGEYEFAGTVPIEDLCSYILTNCYNNHVRRVHLVGPESYARKYCEDIKYEESCRYGFCNLEIEVN